jgi:hypothetical protein
VAYLPHFPILADREWKSAGKVPAASGSGMDQETFNKLFRKRKTEKKRVDPKPAIILPPEVHAVAIEAPEEELVLGPDPNFIIYEYDDDRADEKGEKEEESRREGPSAALVEEPPDPHFFLSTKPLAGFLDSCRCSFPEEKRMVERPLGDWFNLSQNGLFIEFDSLLLFLFSMTCRNDPSAPSDRDDHLICRKYRCSSLHLIFTVRRFLKRLVDYGVTARLIYFLSPPRSLRNTEYQFYRTLTVLHLLTLSHPSIRLHSFESFDSSTFRLFLQQGLPTELVTCELIALDLNLKFAQDYCEQLTERDEINVVHLPSVSGPADVSTIVEKEKGNLVSEILKGQHASPLTVELATSSCPQLAPSNPSQIAYVSFLDLCHELSSLYEQCESMTVKALVCTHLLCLFVQSTLEISQRLVSFSDVLITSEGKVTLSSLISSYFPLFANTFAEYWLDPVRVAAVDSLVWSSPLVDRSDDGEIPDGLHICDLWDGHLLSALHHYCASFGHRTLFSALPESRQALISSHFRPAQFFRWSKVELPPNDQHLSLRDAMRVKSIPLAQVSSVSPSLRLTA